MQIEIASGMNSRLTVLWSLLISEIKKVKENYLTEMEEDRQVKILDSFPLSCKVKNLDSRTQASGRSEWLDISNFRSKIADRNGP